MVIPTTLEEINARIHQTKTKKQLLEKILNPVNKELDELIIQRKKITLSSFEKQRPSSMVQRLKLVTLLREFLFSNIPVFITGQCGAGKTVLAKETASYEFSDVTYLEPLEITKEMKEQFSNAISNHKSCDQLLILDEYQRLKGTNLEITEVFLTQYTGSLMIVTANSSNLPSLELFSEFCIVNLIGNYCDFDYTIQHFKKNARLETDELQFNFDITVPLTTNIKTAITVKSVIDYMEHHYQNNNYNFFNKEVCLGILNKINPQLEGNDYYVNSIILNLEKLADIEDTKIYIYALIELLKSSISLQEFSFTDEMRTGKTYTPLKIISDSSSVIN